MTRPHQFLCASLLGACLTSTAFAEPWQVAGRVVGVHDGDSITLLDQGRVVHKIRLDGIDAPELGQAFGRAAKKSLSDLAYRREATAQCQKRDRYGREVCRVLVGDDDVGLIQLERGMAWFFRRYERELAPERRAAHQSAEDAARGGGAGLWADPEPQPPWNWRKARKRTDAEAPD